MYFTLPLVFLATFAASSPVIEAIGSGEHGLAKPFVNAVLAVPRSPALGFSIFRRQSCDMGYLICPSGVGCCPYGGECCGSSCCDAANGYLCTNGCCVAISDSSNTCGSVNSNPCSDEGYLPCNGINLCCPPSSICYFDSFGIGRCAPQGADPPSEPTPSPTPVDYTPIPSPTPVDYTPIPSPTPLDDTPIPTPDFSSSSGSGSSSSSKSNPKTRLTRAAIGGIIGGVAAFIILVGFLISCCIRRQNGSNSSGPVTPLPEPTIYWRVKNLETTSAWQALYKSEAARIKNHPEVTDTVAWLEDFARRAVTARTDQLRNGGANTYATFFSAFWSLIPFQKMWAIPLSTGLFTGFAIKCLGMGDRADVNRLHREACSKAGLVTNIQEFVEKIDKDVDKQYSAKHAIKEAWMDEDLQAHLQAELQEYLTVELGPEAATQFMEELVHLKAGFGQIISAGRGAWKSTKQMDKALDFLMDRALEFHLRVFVVNAS